MAEDPAFAAVRALSLAQEARLLALRDRNDGVVSRCVCVCVPGGV